MSAVFSVLLALAATAVPAGNGAGTCGQVDLAQAFKVPAGETAKPAKKKMKPRKITNESDLWRDSSVPAGKKARGDEEEAEELPDEDIEDLDEGESGQGSETGQGGLGGWGADAERDSWGDEERIEKAESIPEEKPPPKKTPKQPVKPQPEVAPDKPAQKPVPKPSPKESDKLVEPKKDGRLGVELGESGEILPASGSLADLSALWEQRRIHLDQRDFELARGDLEQLLKLKRELGVRNMTLQANVLVREARRAKKAGKLDQAQELLNNARELAPGLPMVHSALASLWFFESPFKLGRVFGAIVDGVRATLQQPLAANRFKVNLLVGLLLGLGLAGAVFLLVQFLRYLRIFLHDFHHLFPKGVARLQSGILAVLVLVIPILLRNGLVTVLLFWGLIAWVYQERFERLVTGLTVLLFAMAPLILQLVVSGLAYPESIVPDLLEVNQGSASHKSISRLQARLVKQPDNHVILATLGDFHKRTGDLEQARELLSRALAASPNSAELLNNIGNVYFLTNDLEKAIDYYGRAAKIRTDMVIPYFNLSRAYFKRLDLDKGKEHRRYALSLDLKQTNALVERAGSHRANDVVADLPIPGSWLAQPEDGQAERWDQASGRMWTALGGIGTPGSFPFVGGGIILVYVLVLLLSRKLYLSGACVRCGRPVCRRCSTELRDKTVCGQCFHTFTHKDQVDAKSRISKEIQVRQYTRRKESIARGITFILPGVGQLIRERPLRGALFLLVCSCVLVQVFMGPGLMRNPQALQHGFDWLTMIPLMVVFLGFYAWAILDMFKVDH